MLGPWRYTQYFCEENIWQLLADARFADREAYAVFITNRDQQVAMWAQRAALALGMPVVWDYHVVAAVRGTSGFEVWDLDCTEGCPLPFVRWRERSFDAARQLPPKLRPLFRVVRADDFRRRFSSDRAHMRGDDGAFVEPPPYWEPIGASEEPPNLHRFLDLDTPFVGEVLDLAGLSSRFAL